LNSESCCTVGPAATKIRPWCPSDSHDTSDPGPPERSGLVGAAKSGSVSSLTASKVLLIVVIANRTTIPLSSAIVNASNASITTTAETRGGATRLSCRTRNSTSRRTS